MPTSTYQDIIEDKIEAWQNGLKQLAEQAAKAHFDTQDAIIARIKKLRAAIDTAKVQLQNLDAHETVENTMETKNKILKIFSSVDRDFPGFEDETPFML